VTFLQRFGGSLNLKVPCHLIVIEGVFLERMDQSLKPCFIKIELPSDADAADVVQSISRRVICKLRWLGYLEVGIDAAVATGDDPLLDNEPELAYTMAASVKQRVAFGERAGLKVRRIGSGFGDEGERPELTGSRCANVHGCSVHANTEDANGALICAFNRP
jgi:hypothetical protein